MPRPTRAGRGSFRSLPYTGRVTDTIDSHTGASGESSTGPDPASGSTARTAAATLERSTSGPASPSPAPVPVPRAGALPTPGQQAQAAKDKTLTCPAAVELARHALEEVTDPITIGEYLAAVPDADRLVTHLFDCTLSGYRGWRWAVTLSRVPRSRTATVCEMELLPGEEALLAPAWVPWAERLEPGDITRSDRLPRKETDERLEPGWEATGEDADAVALDQLDLGRPRVLSAQGVSSAAKRWYGGDHGPDAEGVRKAHATCSTCGFFVPMAGALRAIFGVCANEWAADDGSVVSLDHGCGAHSETDLPDQGPEWPINPSRVDDHLMVPLSTNGLDLREGRSIAELAAQQSDDGVDSGGEPDGAPDENAADAPGPGAGAEPSFQDVDASADVATATADFDGAVDDVARADGKGGAERADVYEPAAEERSAEAPGKKTGKTARKPAAKRSRRTASPAKRRRTSDSTEETAEDRRGRLLELDLEELGQTTAAAASAASASDAAEVLMAAVDPARTSASIGSGDSPSERAASARAAVAGLSLALGIDALAGGTDEESATRPSVPVPSARGADDRADATSQEDASSAEPEEAEEAEPQHAPRTLADLEAVLPDRS